MTALYNEAFSALCAFAVLYFFLVAFPTDSDL